MGWYSKGFSVKQKDFNINELLNSEFPLGFIDIPFQLIEAGRPSGIFSPIDQNCVVVKRTNNTTYVFFKNIENQIKIEKGIFPKYLKELNNDWLYFNNEIQEFYLKSDSLQAFRYYSDSDKTIIETENNLQLSNLSSNLEIRVDEIGDEYYVYEKNINDEYKDEYSVTKSDLYIPIIEGILSEDYEYNEMEVSTDIKYFLAWNENLGYEYLYNYTGLVNKSEYEEKIEKSKTSLNFGLEMYRAITSSNENKSFIHVVKNILMAPFILVLTLFLILFRNDNTEELKERFNYKISYIIYGITLISLLICINFIKVNSFYDIIKFIGFLIIATFFSSKMLKLLILKKE